MAEQAAPIEATIEPVRIGALPAEPESEPPLTQVEE